MKTCLWQISRFVDGRVCGRFQLQPERGSFQAKEFFFGTKASTVTRKSSIRSQNPMAGNNNSDWVVMVCLAHGAEGIRTANGAGDIAITAGLAVRNAQQRLPAIFLELRSNQIKLKRKSPQFPAKIAFKLRNVWPEMLW